MRDKEGSVVVRHREYISDVVSTGTGFLVSRYSINPGLATSFPWLSQVAQAYESYRFKKLKFLYQPSCSTTTAGTTLMAVDFDASDPSPTGKAQALNYHNATRSPPWSDQAQNCASEDLQKYPQRFIRSGNLGPNQDVVLYDIGNLYVCTSGVSSGTVGELHAEYEVELITPQVSDDVLSAKLVGGGTFSTASPCGSTQTITGQLPVTYAVAGGGSQFTFNRVGEYDMTFSISGVATVMNIAGVTSTGTATSTIIGLATDVPVGNAVWDVIVKVTEPGQTVLFDATSWSNITAVTTRISQYDYDLS